MLPGGCGKDTDEGAALRAPGRYRVPGSVAVCGGALCVPIFTGGFAVAPDGFVEGGHHAANLYNHQL